jgi:hypothetical protein
MGWNEVQSRNKVSWSEAISSKRADWNEAESNKTVGSNEVRSREQEVVEVPRRQAISTLHLPEL